MTDGDKMKFELNPSGCVALVAQLVECYSSEGCVVKSQSRRQAR